jgi:hypothetical protein
MEMQRKITIAVNGKNYTLPRPNNGQILDIETLKHKLSKGLYSQMVYSNVVASQNAVNIIDMMSHMAVLCPEILTDLKIDMSKLDIVDSLPLLKVYMKDVHPWVTEYQTFMQKVTNFLKVKNEEGEGSEE